MKRIIPSLFFILVCTLLPTQGASAVDLSDTVNPIVSIKVLNESQLGADYASLEITYKDDKNLFKGLNGCYQGVLCLVPDMVQSIIAKDAAPVCRAFQFFPTNVHGLNLLTAAEDLTKRVQNGSGVQQVFILRFSTKLLRPDNGCKYEASPLQLVWWVNTFDIYKGIEKFGDEAGNGAYVIGVLPRLGDYGTPAVLFPITASVKLAKSYCGFFAEDQLPVYNYTECVLKNYSKIYKTPTFYQLNLNDLNKAGLFNAVKTSAKDLGDFSDLTYSFNSFNTNVSENVRLIADTSMMLSNPNFPSYKSTKIEDAIFRKAAYEKVEKLADLSQDVDLIAVWNEWVAKSNTDKAAADKAAAEVKAAADKAAATKKSTITCTKGKMIKKVSGIKPKCPAGYKKAAQLAPDPVLPSLAHQFVRGLNFEMKFSGKWF